MSVGLSGQLRDGNPNHRHYHLSSNYSVGDTGLNSFKYIISVNLHDNPKSRYFHPNLQKKLKPRELISECTLTVRVYLTLNPAILKINLVSQLRCSPIRAHKFYKNFNFFSFFMIILKESFCQILRRKKERKTFHYAMNNKF